MRALLLLLLLAPEAVMALENRDKLYDFGSEAPVVEDMTRPGGSVNRDADEARRQDMLMHMERVMRGEISMEDSIAEFRQKWFGGQPPQPPRTPFDLRGQGGQ